MKFRFKKQDRLLKRYEFERLSRSSQRIVSHYIVVEYLINPEDLAPPKLGITVTKKFGDAYKRNRFKRLVREAFRLNRHRFQKGLVMNVRPRANIEKHTLFLIVDELSKLWI